MITQLRERRNLRRAYLAGQSIAFRPPTTRDAAVAQARRALDVPSDRDQHALVIDRAIAAGEDALVRVVSLLLSALMVAARLPPLVRALVVQQIFEETRRLMVHDDEVGNATRH